MSRSGMASKSATNSLLRHRARRSAVPRALPTSRLSASGIHLSRTYSRLAVYREKRLKTETRAHPNAVDAAT